MAGRGEDTAEKEFGPVSNTEFCYCFNTKTCCSLVSAINNTLAKICKSDTVEQGMSHLFKKKPQIACVVFKCCFIICFLFCFLFYV